MRTVGGEGVEVVIRFNDDYNRVAYIYFLV